MEYSLHSLPMGAVHLTYTCSEGGGGVVERYTNLRSQVIQIGR